ncbi:MAG: hypothetical protein ACKVQK_15550 [Burkholderiales bacterium]
MKTNNRFIFFGALTTTLLVALFIKLPFALNAQARETASADVVMAVSLFAAYLILVAGIMVVGANAYKNLARRRADAALQTRGNRWMFNLGVTFCVLGLFFIFVPVR